MIAQFLWSESGASKASALCQRDWFYARSDEKAQYVENALCKCTVFAQDQNPSAAVEEFDRLTDERMQPIDVVCQDGRKQRTPEAREEGKQW